MKHTPGPWTVEISDDAYATYTIIEQRNADDAHADDPNYYTAEEDEANARLIAEAPAMLAELREMMALIESTFPSQSKVWLDNANAIIKRIEG